jgi:hypothetical protein
MATNGTVEHGNCKAAGASPPRETLSAGKTASKAGEGRSTRRRWIISLRRQLLLLALATTLPFLAFSSAVVLWVAGLHREATHQGLETTTRALALTLDKQIEIYQATAAALAISPSLETGDGAALYKQADALARRLGVWIAVSLSSGQQIVNTLRPFDAELPPSNPLTVSRDLPRNGVVHDLFEGPVAKRLIVGVTIPAVRDGALTHYVHLGLAPEHLAAVLASEQLPQQWFAVLVDGQNRVVARAPHIKQAVGNPAPQWLAEGAAARARGNLAGQAFDGGEVNLAFERLSHAPWTVAVAVPRGVLESAWQRPLALVVAGGAALVIAVSMISVAMEARLMLPLERSSSPCRNAWRGAAAGACADDPRARFVS